MQDVQAILPTGTIVRDRYVVEDLLGKGGFGAVYLVRDTRVRGNLFALKEVIDPSKRDREQFVFEGEVLKRLEHRALPCVYYAFENEKQGRAYILMDYIEGTNLETQRQQQPERRFTLHQVLAMMSPIFEAVAFLHNRRPPIIHRDIKPANIIVSETSHESVLVDFGIAKEYDPDSTTTAIRRCSPGYGAPEQYSTGTNTCTDIYGLAATIYALLSGVVPADALYRMTQLGSKRVDPLEPLNVLVPDVPPLIAEAIHKAMAINSNERFATVEQFWQALNDPSSQQAPVPVSLPVTSPPVTPVERNDIEALETTPLQKPPADSRTQKRRISPLLLLLLPLLIGLALAAGIWFYRSNHHTVPTPVVQHGSTAVSTHQPTPGLTPTHPATSPTPGNTATPAATATPQPTPTTRPSQYPTLVPTYNGNLHNSLINEDSSMSLTTVKQNGANISGYFTVGSNMQGSGSFTGTVDTANHIQFTVPGVYGHAPLLFSGTVYPGGSISGDYCSIDSTGKCDSNIGGYGTWNVTPASPGTGSFAPFNPFQGAYRPRDTDSTSVFT